MKKCHMLCYFARYFHLLVLNYVQEIYEVNSVKVCIAYACELEKNNSWCNGQIWRNNCISKADFCDAGISIIVITS
jgi:hypothetical protein